MQGMIGVDEEVIEKKALELAQQKKDWHYHLLTPVCKFNSKKRHTFVLEDNSRRQYYAFYSDEPALDLGKRLLTVLHGKNILGKGSTKTRHSESTKLILAKARQLNREGKFWHHHVFFPVCIFNKHPGKWNITFEDQQTGGVIESLSVVEPEDDQREVEILYYLQRTIT